MIQTLLKLYPLEFMMEDRLGPDPAEPCHAATGARLEGDPAAALGAAPRHPNLLTVHFVDAGFSPQAGWVRKPLFSREGANIEMVTTAGEQLRSPGAVCHPPRSSSKYHPLPCFNGNYPLIGSWVVANVPARIGIREDNSPITRDTSRFPPHAILD